MHFKRSGIAIYALILFLFIGGSGPLLAGELPGSSDALKLLKEGNKRFVEMKLQHPNETIERRQDTAMNGQSPFAVVLACSDSRVPVEAIFDRGIGDIFVVRVAGNIAVDKSVIGSVEYAVKYLNSPLLVIMGHTECGAVKSAVSGHAAEGQVLDIQKVILPIVIKIRKDRPDLAESDMLNVAIRDNALQAKADILDKSSIVKKMADDGKLKIVTAIYDIKTGSIEWIE